MRGVGATNIPSLSDVKLLFKKKTVPIPLDDDLCRLYFVLLLCGSRGAGKSFSAVKLLKLYEKKGIYDKKLQHKVDQRVIVFSPTFQNNPVFTSLKHLDVDNDVIENYSDTKLIEVIKEIQEDRLLTLQYHEDMALWNRYLRIRKITDLSQEEMMIIESWDYTEPTPPPHPYGQTVFLVLDDLVGTNAFKSVGKSALTNLVLKNRHLGICIIIMSQNLKAIPKSIRTNTSVFCIFKFGSRKIICDDLYEEVSNFLTLEEFEQLFDFATSEAHSALVLDFTQKKDKIVKKNWDTILTLN